MVTLNLITWLKKHLPAFSIVNYYLSLCNWKDVCGEVLSAHLWDFSLEWAVSVVKYGDFCFFGSVDDSIKEGFLFSLFYFVFGIFFSSRKLNSPCFFYSLSLCVFSKLPLSFYTLLPWSIHYLCCFRSYITYFISIGST